MENTQTHLAPPSRAVRRDDDRDGRDHRRWNFFESLRRRPAGPHAAPDSGWRGAVGGLIALAGAFIYAELSSNVTASGGQYVYLRDAMHRWWRFSTDGVCCS